ncbi:WD40-like Beta Propeller [Penicillium daleae]|uniref:Dipeptidyl-peptidase V n=1 Tax=Penicillium daleae TaxID=63821 RepID=A0AAD6C439_9EURO|nr:WD40-like Beta Propeller [Penicillium daleae]KAJ5444749.1 WD40-like Beta Propeller [Penicillium daleae]
MPTKSELQSDLSLEALADLQVPSDLHISPDGTKVVYALRPFSRNHENATSSIWIAEIGKEKSSRQITSGLFNDEKPQWAPDSASIAFKSDRAQPGKSSAIYSGIASFEWSPNGRFIAYTSPDEKTDEQTRKEERKEDAKVWGQDLKYHRLRTVHVATKETRILVGGDKHVHAFSWSLDGREIAYVEHQDPDINSAGFHGAKICIVDLTTEISKTITKFPGPVTQFAWGEDGVFFIAGKVPTHCSTSQGLYRLSIPDGTYIQPDMNEEYCCLYMNKNNSLLSYRVQAGLEDEIGYIDDNVRRHVYREKHDIASFDVFKSPGLLITAITKGDGSNPEEVFSISGSANPVKLSDHNNALAALKISRALPIETRATDDYRLDGVMYFPSKYKESDGPLPTILLPHGGPYYRLTIGFSVCHYLEVPLLVSAGYGVLCPNYRGGSGRGQKHAAYARGGVGTVDYQDCIDILHAGIEKGLVDPARVAIGGWSQGGFLSYLAITRDKFSFRGACCGAGVSDWDVMTMTSDAYWFEADLAGGSPWEVDEDAEIEVEVGELETGMAKSGIDGSGSISHKQWLRQTASRKGSALWHMRNVNTPILILHGEEDVRVPLSQAVAFYRACIRNNVPVTMVSYPREGHLFHERKHIVDMWKRMRQFYDLHLN